MASLNEVNKALYAAMNQKTGARLGYLLGLAPAMRKRVRDKFVEMAGEWPATKDKRGTYPVEGDFRVYDAHQRAHICGTILAALSC